MSRMLPSGLMLEAGTDKESPNDRAAISNGHAFEDGRQFSAWLGRSRKLSLFYGPGLGPGIFVPDVNRAAGA